MMKKSIHIPGAPAPIGPYSPALLMENTLYVSGQIPLNPQTGNLEIDTIEEATHRVMQNIKALLNEVGMEFSNVVKCSIFLTDLGNFSKVNEVYGSYFLDVFPARETIQISKLPMDAPVEISCIAIK